LKISNISDSKRQQTTTVDYKRLINGFVLTIVFTLQPKNNSMLFHVNKTKISIFVPLINTFINPLKNPQL